MGYRSDVALLLDKESVMKLQAAITDPALDEETRKEVNNLLDNPEKHLQDADTGAELWYWDSLKWYADYPDVSFIENFLYTACDVDNYRFMRVGESWDDIEVEGCMLDDPFDLYMERRIHFEES